MPGGVAFARRLGRSATASTSGRASLRACSGASATSPTATSTISTPRRKAVDWPKYFAVRAHAARQRHGAEEPAEEPGVRHAAHQGRGVRPLPRRSCGSRPDVDRTQPGRARACLPRSRDAASLYLDTSGEPLFKRGWRTEQGEAPLRENLAAGIIMLTGWKPDEPLLDPMCGGGTLLVEAAAMARGRAPGAKRSFGFEKLARVRRRRSGRAIKRDEKPRTAAAAVGSSAATPIPRRWRRRGATSPRRASSAG